MHFCTELSYLELKGLVLRALAYTKRVLLNRCGVVLDLGDMDKNLYRDKCPELML
jgi:hypothetical protein